MQRFGCRQRNALRIAGMSFSTYRYESRRRDETALKMRIKEITDTRVHYGYLPGVNYLERSATTILSGAVGR